MRSRSLNISWFCKAVSFAMIALVAACASDNVHQPEPDATPGPQDFDGSITSSIPIIPSFVPVTSPDHAKITWIDESQSMATIELGGFHVDVAEVSMSIEIGDMTITPVNAFRQADGSFELLQSEFHCRAGAYATTGSLEGTLSDDGINFTILYKPGSMPFFVQSVFSSN